ncbi:hypothetical protein CWB72_10585 [Pseudoalteromonas phenolica]|uniref:hypothetical protein n=1 Tax=Pseudoalteromonas phenolica TaxID=161398 RepID=UPI00110A6939|nr:hypothetical protein [Pseudoalteromonas phenolica]TMN89475.1 hypothetical protein CWB72_10585 [Pseudoalteromonas phenolica]
MSVQLENEIKNSVAATLKEEQRTQILYSVGDIQSLLGTTSDTVHLLLFEFAKLLDELSKVSSIDEVKAASFNTSQIFRSLLQKHTNGEFEFPYEHKGLEKVEADIEQRAQGITNIIKTNNT